MSGHSKWSTIKRQKGVADIKRGLTFTKVANAITIAAKIGGSGDPETNPRLRMVMEEAKSVNMPKENVQRAIDRGLGKLPGQVLEEILYEGFGAGKIGYLLEVVTDNKLRTLAELKNLFSRAGGSLAGNGSVSYMFERLGELKVKSSNLPAGKAGLKVKSEEEETMELIDIGAEDIEPLEEDGIRKYLVYVQSPELNTMGNKITQANFTIESQELIYKPNILVEIKDPETAKRVVDFTEKLEGLDDVQKVFANYDIAENLI